MFQEILGSGLTDMSPEDVCTCVNVCENNCYEDCYMEGTRAYFRIRERLTMSNEILSGYPTL